MLALLKHASCIYEEWFVGMYGLTVQCHYYNSNFKFGNSRCTAAFMCVS